MYVCCCLFVWVACVRACVCVRVFVYVCVCFEFRDIDLWSSIYSDGNITTPIIIIYLLLISTCLDVDNTNNSQKRDFVFMNIQIFYGQLSMLLIVSLDLRSIW